MLAIRISTRTFGLAGFCSQKTPRTETIQIKKNTVLNLKHLSYEPRQKLQFVNGKCLLYQNDKKWFVPHILYLHLEAMMVYVAYLMKYNPFYLSFPASLPLMICLEAFLFRRRFLKQKKYAHLISKIYLLQDGQVIQIEYANRMARRLKELPLSQLFFISNLLDPDESQQHRPIPSGTTRFPKTQKDVTAPGLFDYAWTKYYLNWHNHLMIPMHAEYINMEVLTQIFNGKVIALNRDKRE